MLRLRWQGRVGRGARGFGYKGRRDATMPCVPGTKAGDRRGIGGGAHTPGRRMSVKDVVPEDWTEVLA